MTKKLLKKVTEKQRRTEQVSHITQIVLSFLEKEQEEYGDEAAMALAYDVVASYVASLTSGVLSASASRTGKNREDLALDSFAEHKAFLQEAVAAGVGGAVGYFSGKVTDYYCTIKLMPESINRMPV